MKIGSFKFDRLEFAGSLGDLGTLIPLSIGMLIFNGLSVTTVFLMVGIFYIYGGLYFKLPIPVQPLKVVAALAIASPKIITVEVIAAGGIIFGVILLLIAFTGIIDKIAKFFTKPVIRGIQLGLGLILAGKGIDLILQNNMFINDITSVYTLSGFNANTMTGVVFFIITLLLLTNKKFPAAIVAVSSGFIIGIFYGNHDFSGFTPGPSDMNLYIPTLNNFKDALFYLVLPQIPLTIGNAIIGTNDACSTLFGINLKNVSNRSFSFSMGIVNVFTGFLGGMPMCHGAGGLAAHHRFGARTGGSNLMIGAVFICIALIFGAWGIKFLSLIPNAILGILLVFAGIELTLLIRDVNDKNDLFAAILVALIGFTTKNMGVAFVAGFIAVFLINKFRIKL